MSKTIAKRFLPPFFVLLMVGLLPMFVYTSVSAQSNTLQRTNRVEVADFSEQYKDENRVFEFKNYPILRMTLIRRVVPSRTLFVKQVKVIQKGQEHIYVTQYKSVRDVVEHLLGLEESRVLTNPKLDVELKEGMVINVTNVLHKIKNEHKDIAFKVKEIKTDSLEYDKVKIKQKGQLGKMLYVHELTFWDGKLKSDKVIEKHVVKNPITEIKLIGTKKVCRSAIVDGRSISYWNKMHVWTTSYDHTCYGCSHWTATGKYLTKGIIAVDPRVIKMHTTMYVKGYGFGQAEDTGGAIKGKHLDLAFDDIKHGFWSARWTDVYLIDGCMKLGFNWRTKWD